jgi:hypothetical protein
MLGLGVEGAGLIQVHKRHVPTHRGGRAKPVIIDDAAAQNIDRSVGQPRRHGIADCTHPIVGRQHLEQGAQHHRVMRASRRPLRISSASIDTALTIRPFPQDRGGQQCGTWPFEQCALQPGMCVAQRGDKSTRAIIDVDDGATQGKVEATRDVTARGDGGGIHARSMEAVSASEAPFKSRRGRQSPQPYRLCRQQIGVPKLAQQFMHATEVAGASHDQEAAKA